MRKNNNTCLYENHFYTSMCLRKHFLVFAVILAVSNSQEDDERSTERSLRLVHVIFRHGARTPEKLDLYPKDIYNSSFFIPPGYGQLTNKGKRNAYQLGKSLRARYNDLLGDEYSPDLIRTTTTDYVRTKMSALLVHAGLFPPNISQKWDENLDWQPIPYDFDKFENDFRWRRPVFFCPEYKTELKRVLNKKENIEYLADRRQKLRYIEEQIGKPIRTLEDAFFIYQVWSAEKAMGLKFPSWLRQQEYDLILEITVRQCHAENYNTKLIKLGGGRMMQAIIKNMEEKAKNDVESDVKMFLYSGHDYNVYNLLGCMNLYDFAHFPKYSSAVIFELHYLEDHESWAVKILYQESETAEPRELVLPSCITYCPLDKFVEVVSEFVPANYTEECKSSVNLG